MDTIPLGKSICDEVQLTTMYHHKGQMSGCYVIEEINTFSKSFFILAPNKNYQPPLPQLRVKNMYGVQPIKEIFYRH